MKQYGAQLATKMVSRLITSRLVTGVHFCTLNLEKSIRTILENLGWTSDKPDQYIPSPLRRHNKLIDDDDDSGSRLSPPVHALSISPNEASQLAEWGLRNNQGQSSKPPAPTTNTQTTNGEDSWDEYPNGRFTDVRSPAYGEIDGWGSGLKITVSYHLRLKVTS